MSLNQNYCQNLRKVLILRFDSPLSLMPTLTSITIKIFICLKTNYKLRENQQNSSFVLRQKRAIIFLSIDFLLIFEFVFLIYPQIYY